MAPTISCVVLTYNEERNILPCLETLAWADECLVLDSGSTDNTVALARQVGARVEYRPFCNYPDQRNAALDLANSEWVFFVDADERVTPDLAAEVRQAIELPKVGYWVPRYNIIFGKVIKHTGWYPDYQPRIFRKGYGRFDPARIVHELPIFAGEAGYLKNPLIHYNYATVRQFLTKQMRYAAFDVQRLYDEGVRPRFWAPVLQPLRQFRWRFFTLKGYLDGGHGLLLSLLMAYYDFVVYSRLRRLTRTLT